jgi:hypothetical protein
MPGTSAAFARLETGDDHRAGDPAALLAVRTDPRMASTLSARGPEKSPAGIEQTNPRAIKTVAFGLPRYASRSGQ